MNFNVWILFGIVGNSSDLDFIYLINDFTIVIFFWKI